MANPSEIVAQLLEDELDPRELMFQAADERTAAETSKELNVHNAQLGYEFYHKFAVYADCVTPIRARRNGKTQTWKTRPGLFRIPIKIGMYDYGQIDNFFQKNSDEWQTEPPVHTTRMPRIQIRF